MYVTVGPDAFTTAVAEYFQDGSGAVGPIDPATCSPAATSFRVAADVALLDLSSPWVTRAGGNQAICSGRRSAARSWARAIHHHHPSIVGLRYRSSIWGPGTCIVLWERAAAAIPDGVVLHRALADATLDSPLAEAAQQLGAVLLP